MARSRSDTTRTDLPNLLTDPSTNQTHLTNDASGHVLSVVDATSGSAAFTYDGNGNLFSSITDGNIHTRSFTYDFRGNLVTETDPLHHTSTNEYDNAGHLVRRVDRANRETTFTYDADGHVVSRTMPGGDVTTYVYDPLGRLIGANNNARQIVIQRDELGRLTNETDAGTAAAPMPSTDIAIAYDADSRRISSSGPDGAIGYDYDAQSRLKTLTDQAGEAFNFTFDAASRLTSLTRPNGVDDAMTFDASDVVLSIVSTLGAATVASSTYGYDPQGQRSSATDLVGTSTFGHDASGRLTGASYPGGTFPTAAYAYDHAGNRTSGGATFDDANRLTSNGGFSYTYDAEGELVARHDIASGATTTFDWNAAHQLTGVHLPGGATTTYRYDALGRRVELAHGGVRTSYVYDGNKIRIEYDSTGHVAAWYTTGMPDDSVLEMTRAGQRYFYLTDAQGSTVALTNEAGAVVSTYRYDAFGNQTSTGTVENPFTFQGREFDSASGLYYFRARYYDPAAGRFVSEDPLEGANQYAFAANDPVDFGDPNRPVRIRRVWTCRLVSSYRGRGSRAPPSISSRQASRSRRRKPTWLRSAIPSFRRSKARSRR